MSKKIAGIAACVLWALSFILSFVVPPGSALIWIPDTVLLVGFFPLIWICPYSLVWIAFGVLTTFIGAFLLLLTNIPATALPAQSIPVKEHLAIYHSYWAWMLIGLFVTICGVFRICFNGFRILTKKP